MSEEIRREENKTREIILKTAEEEFANKGFYGARVDEIARNSTINKRIIYQNFNSKEQLYKEVLIHAYTKMAKAESELFTVQENATQTIKNLIRMYFDYLKSNPTYVSLILWENLHKGLYVNDLDFSNIKNKVYDFIYKVLQAGKKNGEFRGDFNEDQVILSILTFTFSYFSNRYTLSNLLKGKVDFEKDYDERIAFVTDMILKTIKN